MRIRWLEPAQEDLRQLRAYYVDNAGVAVTRNRIKEIMESVSLLSANPYLGKGLYISRVQAFSLYILIILSVQMATPCPSGIRSR